MRAPAAIALGLLLAACASKAPEPAPDAGAEPAAPAPAVLEVRPATPVKDYPLDTCVVSGESLGLMGEPVAVEVDGVVIHLCCNHCIEDIRKDPARYVSIVKAAMRSRVPPK
jgi:hypothetical protein